MVPRGCILAALLAVAVLVAGGLFLRGWYGSGPLEEDRTFVVPSGSSLNAVAAKLEKEGAIRSAGRFSLRARLFGGGAPIKAGEFLLPSGASQSQVLAIIQSDDVIRRYVTIPEGMPSVMVQERLMAQEHLTGEVPVPEEGSVLPESYDFERGETREAVLRRMQAAMRRTLRELWSKRSRGIAVRTPEEALILASIVEKETGKPSERRLVAGLYSNRLKKGMLLQGGSHDHLPDHQGASRSAGVSANPKSPQSTTTIPIRWSAFPRRRSPIPDANRSRQCSIRQRRGRCSWLRMARADMFLPRRTRSMSRMSRNGSRSGKHAGSFNRKIRS